MIGRMLEIITRFIRSFVGFLICDVKEIVCFAALQPVVEVTLCDGSDL